MNGILVIRKEQGYTSHDVVAKLRGILHVKKIGHTGTLDPDATGVLPVCIGNATKVCDLIMEGVKVYTAGVKLGVTTDTQDVSGTVLKECKAYVSEEDVRRAAESFLGESLQLTPMYSARKVGGHKLVDLARKGITVERERKKIRIDRIEISTFDREAGTFSMVVQCSKGTYIRTLCNDIGEALGCGACMTSLIRNETTGFKLEDAHTIDEVRDVFLAGNIDSLLIPADTLFTDYGRADITEEGKLYLHNGNPLYESQLNVIDGPAEKVRVYEDNEFKALYELRDGMYRPMKMFL
ncbi:MAG: tRNA pseudouridine(55) synthase TruB [Lachnospiraceae bacterium]|nr:tRNA pseudouridine(55) synthase TruB [Lachnospiraceae bacterium]